MKEVEGNITAEEALRCTYKLIFKQNLKEIREWGLLTEREGLMEMERYHFYFNVLLKKSIKKI